MYKCIFGALYVCRAKCVRRTPSTHTYSGTPRDTRRGRRQPNTKKHEIMINNRCILRTIRRVEVVVVVVVIVALFCGVGVRVRKIMQVRYKLINICMFLSAGA